MQQRVSVFCFECWLCYLDCVRQLAFWTSPFDILLGRVHMEASWPVILLEWPDTLVYVHILGLCIAFSPQSCHSWMGKFIINKLLLCLVNRKLSNNFGPADSLVYILISQENIMERRIVPKSIRCYPRWYKCRILKEEQMEPDYHPYDVFRSKTWFRR